MRRNSRKTKPRSGAAKGWCAPAGLIAILLMVWGAEGCGPLYGVDDTDATWLHKTVPVLLGRKVHGQAEGKVLQDLTELVGQEEVARMLMNEPDFVEHWAEVFVNGLRVDREGQRYQGPTTGANATGGCYGEPLLNLVTPSIAEHIRDHPPDVTYHSPSGPSAAGTGVATAFRRSDFFNLSDVAPLRPGAR